MLYGCIGETLKHSFSAQIHPLLNDSLYELREVPREELERFIQKKDFLGINVTIPYKQSVIPYLDWIEPLASEIGAVNTVVNRDGKLYGYNTDFYGMCALFGHIGADLRGKKIAILGTGGTSLTALAVARHLGAREILRVSRREGEGAVTYESLAELHRDVQVIINTTPVGMYPHAQESPVSLSAFSTLESVADAVYNPLRTELVLEARERGIPAEGGLFMLVAQAVRASELFHDCQYPEGTVERIWRTLAQKKENVVLIGMPGSGKTTVGRLLAESLGREFLDMDVEITNVYGRTPAEIIRKDGEPAFRDLETAILREHLCARTGVVLATGGGAVLRTENVRMLRQNGRLVWLDRPLEKLIPTCDRPLSDSEEQMACRYRERYGIYRAAADLHINDPKTAEEAAERIGKEFGNQ